jgi:ribosomal-protein-alanine N-acetyltransferase
MSALALSAEDRFEPMRIEDLEQVEAVERSIYLFPWTRGNFRDALSAGNSAWLLRGVEGGLIGYSVVMYALDEAHLLNLSVAQPFQGKGHGWRLLDWTAALARERGGRTLLLEVRPSNPAAQRLYARYGFERIGLRRGYYPAIVGREDAIVMRVSL